MTDEKELALVRDFPGLFRDHRGDPRKTCMSWGCAVGDGWEPLLRRLCEAARLEPGGPHFAQIKEKFGGLRVYWNNATEKLWVASQLAEDESFKTCEACGTVEDVATKGPGWIKTLCGTCRQAWDKRKTPGLAEASPASVGGIPT